MIDTEALRKKVIDLAIQGKLTEQLPSDGDAETLYAQILEYKLQLIKEGKIKKDKTLPDITEDEIPFEIPKNWKWVRLANISNSVWAGGDKPSDFVKERDASHIIPVVGNGVANEGILGYTSEATASSNTVTVAGRGTIGYCVLRNYEYCPIVRLVVVEPSCGIDAAYLRYVIKCLPVSSVGSSIPQLTVPMLKPKLIPLPPLSEQKRIVEVLDSVFNQFEFIDNLQAKYSNDLAVLKSKIIDSGIQGKLTEQLPEDGDAEMLFNQIQEEKAKLIKEGKIKKEKSLADIMDDEIPFDIPKTWKWVRLNQVTNKITDGTHHSPINTPSGDYMYVTAKNIKNDGVNLDNITYVSKSVHEEIYSRCNPEKNDILLVKDGATTGIVTVNNLDFPFSLLSSVALIKPSKYLDPWFVMYMMRSSWFSKHIRKEMTGVGITRVVLRQIESFIIPLPPLKEQKRIAEKITEMLLLLN